VEEDAIAELDYAAAREELAGGGVAGGVGGGMGGGGMSSRRGVIGTSGIRLWGGSEKERETEREKDKEKEKEKERSKSLDRERESIGGHPSLNHKSIALSSSLGKTPPLSSSWGGRGLNTAAGGTSHDYDYRSTCNNNNNYNSNNNNNNPIICDEGGAVSNTLVV